MSIMTKSGLAPATMRAMLRVPKSLMAGGGAGGGDGLLEFIGFHARDTRFRFRRVVYHEASPLEDW
jgi:hypothetical protein